MIDSREAYITKQEEILKQFKDIENFFENVEQSKSTVYYKISLYTFLKRQPKLKTRCQQVILEVTLRLSNKSVKNIQIYFYSQINQTSKNDWKYHYCFLLFSLSQYFLLL